MNQQNPGRGSSSPNTPGKRKRGRPRKEASTVQAEPMPVRHVPNISINPNQTASTTGSADNEMLGKAVTGVIEGCFGGGYLLNVRIEDSPTCLRGVVFELGQFVPITPENDVAPYLEMIQRREFPVPGLDPHAQMQSSIPSSGEGSKQPVEPNPPVPIFKGQGLPTEIHSGDQPASVLAPMTNIPTSGLSIPAGGIPQTLSDPGRGGPSASIMKMLRDKIVEQNAKKLDTSGQLKEPGADGGAVKVSKPTAEDSNLLPMTENVDRELQTGQHTGSSVQLNEQIQDFPKISNVELNQMPATAGPEPMQSEQIQDEPKNLNIEVNQPPVSAEPEPMQSEHIHDELSSSNMELNQPPVPAEPELMQSEQIHDEPRSSNMELNHPLVSAEPEPMQSEHIHDEPTMELNQPPVPAEPEPMQSEQIHDEPRSSNMELNHPPVSAEPEAMQSEQIHDEPRNLNLGLDKMPVSADPKNLESFDKLGDKPDSPKPALEGDAVPSESRFGSEGSDLPETSDPQNHGPSGETSKEDDIQPSGETNKPVEPENPIGPDNL